MCHGETLEGGNAQGFIDGIWQFGDKSSYMFRNIKHGITQLGMPPYEETLTDEEIKVLVRFIETAEETAGVLKISPPETLQTLDYEIKVDIWLDGLEIPWAIDFTGKQTALVTERPGRLRRFQIGGSPDGRESAQFQTWCAHPCGCFAGWKR